MFRCSLIFVFRKVYFSFLFYSLCAFYMVRVWKMHQLYCYVIIRVGMCRYLNWFYLIHKVFGIGFCTNCLLLLCTFSNFLFDSNLLLLVVLLFGIEIEGLYSTMELVQVKTINESHSLFSKNYTMIPNAEDTTLCYWAQTKNSRRFPSFLSHCVLEL